MPIMPGAPPPYVPTGGENVLLGLGSVLLGLIIGPPASYGLGALGLLLAALGVRNMLRDRRRE